MERKLVLVEVDPVLVRQDGTVDADVDVEDPLILEAGARVGASRACRRTSEAGNTAAADAMRSNASSSPSASLTTRAPRSILAISSSSIPVTRSASALPREAIPPCHGYQKCDVAPTWATSSVSAPVTIRSTSGVGTAADPVEVHHRRLDGPDLSRVRNHQPVGDAVTEHRAHPLLVVRRLEAVARAALDGVDEPHKALAHELDRKTVEVRLEREARVQVVRGVVDERLPLLRPHVLPEELTDEGLHRRVVREEDVRPEVEDVAVDDDGAGVAARLVLLLEHSQSLWPPCWSVYAAVSPASPAPRTTS